MASPAGRKPSVSISESASPEPKSSTGIPAAGSGTKIVASEVARQLRGSIPEKELGLAQAWKVKQVVVTRLDQGGSGNVAAVTGINVAPAAVVAPKLGMLKRQGTSKMHKFAPAVTLDQAIQWLSEYGNADSSLLFENNNWSATRCRTTSARGSSPARRPACLR